MTESHAVEQVHAQVCHFLGHRLHVAVASAGKATHFDLGRRLAMFRAEVAARGLEGVDVEPFEGLLVERARELGARILVRSMRGSRDYEFEMQMAFANRDLAPEIETVFLAPSPATALVSSSLVREVASLGGDVSAWVPPAVARALGDDPPAA